MDQPTTVGLDLAKSVFHVHGVDAVGRVVVRLQLRRARVLGVFERLGPCLVGMEACSGSHHRARELAGLGHEVRLMVRRDRGPGGAAKARRTAYVKPYVKRGRTDATDAEAICGEA
jgi:transposase